MLYFVLYCIFLFFFAKCSFFFLSIVLHKITILATSGFVRLAVHPLEGDVYRLISDGLWQKLVWDIFHSFRTKISSITNITYVSIAALAKLLYNQLTLLLMWLYLGVSRLCTQPLRAEYICPGLPSPPNSRRDIGNLNKQRPRCHSQTAIQSKPEGGARGQRRALAKGGNLLTSPG